MAHADERAFPRDDDAPEPPATGPAEVRLTRNWTITPTLLNHYRTCPHRVRLQYIDKVPQPPRYDHNLSQGIIAHSLLALAAHRRRLGKPLPDRKELWQRAFHRVPIREFPSPEAHAYEVRNVIRWVETGIRYVQRDPDGEIDQVERPQKRSYGPDDPLSLSFRPDLVWWTADAEGPYLEIIDYKTGKRRPDDLVPVIARFVINSFLKQQGYDSWKVPVCFTWVCLDFGERTTVWLDSERCSVLWPEATDVVERLFAETAWLPTPSFLCRYCPYYQGACTAGDATDMRSPGFLYEGPGDAG